MSSWYVDARMSDVDDEVVCLGVKPRLSLLIKCKWGLRTLGRLRTLSLTPAHRPYLYLCIYLGLVYIYNINVARAHTLGPTESLYKTFDPFNFITKIELLSSFSYFLYLAVIGRILRYTLPLERFGEGRL